MTPYRMFCLYSLIVMPFVGFATNVHWGAFENEDVYYYESSFVEGQGALIYLHDLGNRVDLFAQIEMMVVSGAMSYHVVFSRYSDNPSENVMAAVYGDIVSADTIRNLSDDKYLIHNYIDDGRHDTGTATINVLPNNIYYLAFVSEGEYPCYDIVYGWASYVVDWDGNFSIINLAYDLDGGPMIVGGGAYSIPEPSSGLLLLIGISLLVLRRRVERLHLS